METSSLCAKIPVDLHQKVREKQQESNMPLGDYMADLLEKFFKMTEGKTMSDKTRTVACQVTEEDFYRLKAHVNRIGEKQKEFIYKVIFDVITAAEAEIPVAELQEQLLEAEIAGEKKQRNRNPQAEEDNNTAESANMAEENQEEPEEATSYQEEQQEEISESA
ncbi:MAG: hypothetical protein R3Y63_13115 [Eubacteriales bacterium]